MGYGGEIPEGGSEPKGNVTWASYTERGWAKPNLVAYMESHDEERIMFKNLAYGKQVADYDVRNLATALKRTEAAAVILMSFPGPKMIWQFGERGYDQELNNDRLGKKPPHWEYMDVLTRKSLYDVYAKMNTLRASNPIFSTTDYITNTRDNYKQILLKSPTGYICAIANFDTVALTANVAFNKIGTWTDSFTGASINVTANEMSIQLQPGEYHLYMIN